MNHGDTCKVQEREHGHLMHGLCAYCGLPLLALVLYVLSLGPAEKFYADRTPPALIVQFYQPLNWLGRNCKPAGHFLGWYVYGVWIRPAKSALP